MRFYEIGSKVINFEAIAHVDVTDKGLVRIHFSSKAEDANLGVEESKAFLEAIRDTPNYKIHGAVE